MNLFLRIHKLLITATTSSFSIDIVLASLFQITPNSSSLQDHFWIDPESSVHTSKGAPQLHNTWLTIFTFFSHMGYSWDLLIILWCRFFLVGRQSLIAFQRKVFTVLGTCKVQSLFHFSSLIEAVEDSHLDFCFLAISRWYALLAENTPFFVQAQIILS